MTHQSMSARQWIILTVVYLLIPLTLMICGGDVSWWQAWFYAVMIVAAGLGGRIWAERRHPGLTAERQNPEIINDAKSWDKILAPLMAIGIGFPVVIVAGLDRRYSWSPELPVWLNAIGLFFVASGYAFAAWAFAENRFFYSVVSIQTERGHAVCDSGPYRIVRHPGYAGNIVALFGIVLALGSLWTLVPVMVTATVSILRTALEDRTLQQELPGYSDYARRVRFRLIPWVW